MNRWESMQPGYRRRGRGRRRTVPLRPFDPVPSHLVDAAKRLFTEGRWDTRVDEGTGAAHDPPPEDDHQSRRSIDSSVTTWPFDWRANKYLLNFAW